MTCWKIALAVDLMRPEKCMALQLLLRGQPLAPLHCYEGYMRVCDEHCFRKASSGNLLGLVALCSSLRSHCREKWGGRFISETGNIKPRFPSISLGRARSLNHLSPHKFLRNPQTSRAREGKNSVRTEERRSTAPWALPCTSR